MSNRIRGNVGQTIFKMRLAPRGERNSMCGNVVYNVIKWRLIARGMRAGGWSGLTLTSWMVWSSGWSLDQVEGHEIWVFRAHNQSWERDATIFSFVTATKRQCVTCRKTKKCGHVVYSDKKVTRNIFGLNSGSRCRKSCRSAQLYT